MLANFLTFIRELCAFSHLGSLFERFYVFSIAVFLRRYRCKWLPVWNNSSLIGFNTIHSHGWSTLAYGVFTRSSKRPANFQQMYSKYTWMFAAICYDGAGRLLDRINILLESGKKLLGFWFFSYYWVKNGTQILRSRKNILYAIHLLRHVVFVEWMMWR